MIRRASSRANPHVHIPHIPILILRSPCSEQWPPKMRVPIPPQFDSMVIRFPLGATDGGLQGSARLMEGTTQGGHCSAFSVPKLLAVMIDEPIPVTCSVTTHREHCRVLKSTRFGLSSVCARLNAWGPNTPDTRCLLPSALSVLRCLSGLSAQELRQVGHRPLFSPATETIRPPEKQLALHHPWHLPRNGGAPLQASPARVLETCQDLTPRVSGVGGTCSDRCYGVLGASSGVGRASGLEVVEVSREIDTCQECD